MTTPIVDELSALFLASRTAQRAEQRAHYEWLRCGHDAQPPCEHKAEMDRLRDANDEAFMAVLTAMNHVARRGWYDSHENLSLLVDWLGETPSIRHAIEKPWNYEGEFKTATEARDHELVTEHQVLKDGMRDDYAYCDGCGWTCTAGDVQWLCPFCETLLEEADDVERKAHLGCLADVAHDEDVARQAMSS